MHFRVGSVKDLEVSYEWIVCVGILIAFNCADSLLWIEVQCRGVLVVPLGFLKDR